jgi:thioredoxin 1
MGRERPVQGSQAAERLVERGPEVTTKNTIAVGGGNWDEEVMHSEQPVLVDFWAPWCAPCRMIGPALEELAGELAGRAKIVKLNIDTDQDIANRYGVTSIPSLILFRGGRVVDQRIGAAPKAEIARFLSAHVEAETSPTP